ncbi:anthranilate synthase component II [Plantactinospora sp. WMMB334]|uniref:anthranilate synthase component II n=1 Tax=Plantactinospora sp. WMMB334 TaxID=3404119 RepID=UPI003B938ED1
MIFVIDNYDSFVYNLVQYLGTLGLETVVRRHDEVDLDDIAAARPELLLISPGPAAPEQAGISLAAVRRFTGVLPILGVCLGHQCIGQAAGGRIVRARRPMHGKRSVVFHDGTGAFAGLPPAISVVRYHSLVVDARSVPEDLRVTAVSDDGEIMAVAHRFAPTIGLQFHPESIFTDHGRQIVRNCVDTLVAAPQPVAA